MSPKSIDVVMAELDHLKEDFKELKLILLKHMEHEEAQMEKLLSSLDNKYATKWVEKFLAWLAIMIFVGVAWLAGNAIIQSIQHQEQHVTK